MEAIAARGGPAPAPEPPREPQRVSMEAAVALIHATLPVAETWTETTPG